MEHGKTILHDGIATETDEDLAGIANLAYKVLDLHRDITGKRNGSVTVSVIVFRTKNTFSISMVWSTRCGGNSSQTTLLEVSYQ